jgi:hypothetical protein
VIRGAHVAEVGPAGCDPGLEGDTQSHPSLLLQEQVPLYFQVTAPATFQALLALPPPAQNLLQFPFATPVRGSQRTMLSAHVGAQNMTVIYFII